MSARMIGRKNKLGLTLDDLRSMVADAERVGPYVKLKAKTKMNGTLIELTIDEPDDEPASRPVDPGEQIMRYMGDGRTENL